MRNEVITIKYDARVNDKYENQKLYIVHRKREKTLVVFTRTIRCIAS